MSQPQISAIGYRLLAIGYPLGGYAGPGPWNGTSNRYERTITCPDCMNFALIRENGQRPCVQQKTATLVRRYPPPSPHQKAHNIAGGKKSQRPFYPLPA